MSSAATSAARSRRRELAGQAAQVRRTRGWPISGRQVTPCGTAGTIRAGRGRTRVRFLPRQLDLGDQGSFPAQTGRRLRCRARATWRRPGRTRRAPRTAEIRSSPVRRAGAAGCRPGRRACRPGRPEDDAQGFFNREDRVKPGIGGALTDQGDVEPPQLSAQPAGRRSRHDLPRRGSAETWYSAPRARRAADRLAVPAGCPP